MSDRSFRERGAENLSSESSGTAQHHLLLDEFYRSAILVAGRAPVWWLVPPQAEHAYASYVHALRERRFIKAHEYLDFGSVATVQAAEFFGATLWQLAKALTAPHKSILKILLLEAYAADHPRIDLLSLRFKQAVQAGAGNVDRLDPYVLLQAKVEEYLGGGNDEERLELARRCFYYKLDLPLSRKHVAARDWRHEIAQELTERWGWGERELTELDVRASWKIDRTLSERRALVAALTHSYKRLSAFARDRTDAAMVSQRDMTVLGRKLFTAFEQKAGKVELVNLGIAEDLTETHLTLQQTSSAQGQEYWLLFRSHETDKEAGNALKRSWTAFELLAWCHFNGLLTPATRVVVNARDSWADGRDVVVVKEHLQRHLPAQVASHAALEAFATTPGLRAAALYVNLGLDPLAARTRDGTQITTSRIDALSFNAWRENLVQEIDYLVVDDMGRDPGVQVSRHRRVDGVPMRASSLGRALRVGRGGAASGIVLRAAPRR